MTVLMHMSNALQRRSRLLLAYYLLVSVFSEDVLVEARGGKGGCGRDHSSARGGSSSGVHSSTWYGRTSWSSAHYYGFGGAEKWNGEQIQIFFIACGLVLLILVCTMMFRVDKEEYIENKIIKQEPSDGLDQSVLRLDKGSIV
ncbi:hypothetical protein PRIPAC_89864 [Pristionchus pacificus]|uniref:Uncharacterized protein n=1 Tax=Pristionchus pacificus TaxID=54126 RepID=A0A2A6B7T4_PRIPA|nr:hypothetical protein PRIPAC_89864 [Pristionchus pacificus]|eukprot:PDM61923.1 hypothetical protein PRIPAC_51365 [Pristionchus pacificus]